MCQILAAAGDEENFSRAVKRLVRWLEPPDSTLDSILSDVISSYASQERPTVAATSSGFAIPQPNQAPPATRGSERSLVQPLRDWLHGIAGACFQVRGAAARLKLDAPDEFKRREYMALEDLPLDILSRHNPTLISLLARCRQADRGLQAEASRLEAAFSQADADWRSARAETGTPRDEGAAARLLLRLDALAEELLRAEETVERICCILETDSGSFPTPRGEAS
jgi:hypothetical protein